MPGSNPYFELLLTRSEMGERLRATDWARTPLGPVAAWPQPLRTAVGICLNSRFPIAIWWGSRLITLYNDACIALLGARHPAAFAQPASEVWRDAWARLGPQVAAIMQGGQAALAERARLIEAEESCVDGRYMTWAASPIPDELGHAAGIYWTGIEETAGVIAERERAWLSERVGSEQARFAEAFEQSPALLAILKGPHHVFEFVNARYRELIGKRAVLGKPIREALPEIAGQGFFEILDRVYESGQSFAGSGARVLLRPADGGEPVAGYFDFVYQAMRDMEGAVRGILAHGIEVTDRIRREARDSFLIALEGAVRALRDPGEITRVCARMLNENLGTDRSIYFDIGEDGTAAVAGEYHRAGPGLAGPYRLEDFGTEIAAKISADECAVVPDGGERNPPLSSLHFYAVTDTRSCLWVPLHRAGRPVAAMAVLRATPHRWSAFEERLVREVAGRCWEWQERGRTEQALRQAREETDRASRMKDEFLATLSHELRSPLNAVMGWSAILRHSSSPQDIAQGMDVIERNVRAQTRIIDELLDMSAIVSGKVKITTAVLDLDELVCQAVEAARPDAERKAVRLEYAPAAEGPVRIRGDARRITQILSNLLANAIKFTPGEGSVEVRLERAAGCAELSVADTGAGIAPEFMPFVFDRFRQEDASTTRRYGGLGLGLSIVRRLTELHGGTARALSAGVGRGSTFVISLPLEAASDASGESGPARGTARRLDGGRPEEAYGMIAGLDVLVVDDDSDARDLVRRLLEDFDAGVSTAGSVGEAVNLLQKRRFDVIVTDIGMPGEDGYALLRRLRALGPERGGDAPAIALTAYAAPEDRVRALRAGFQMHASKPIEPAELVAMVANLGRRSDKPEKRKTGR